MLNVIQMVTNVIQTNKKIWTLLIIHRQINGEQNNRNTSNMMTFYKVKESCFPV